MRSIIIAKQYCQGLRIRECGTLWEVAIKKCKKIMKLKDVMYELKVQKIEKALLFIKWENFTTSWDHNFNSKQFMHSNQI